MTAPRRSRKLSARPLLIGLGLAAALSAGITSLVAAATTEWVVIDRRTGLGDARDSFAVDPYRAIAVARANWPEVRQDLP